MASISGKLLTARHGVGPTTITGIVSGEIREVPDDLDATDSDSAPYGSTDVGCTQLVGQLKIHHRTTGTQPAMVKAGTILLDLDIFPHGASNPEWHMEEAICLEGTNQMEIRGQVVYTINFKSRGAYTVPGE